MLNVLYAGSPDAAKITLEELIEASKDSNFKIVGVLTNPPSVQGRHKTPVPTPVETLAVENGIPVFNPEHLDTPCREAVQKTNPDIMVCFAYGHIFGPKFMGLFRFGGINLHPSALPEFRGCTPVNAAILNMKQETAFTIQKVSPKMDEGNILAQQKVTLTGKETSTSLLNNAAHWGAGAFAQILKEIAETDEIPEGRAQEGEASYTGIIKKEDARLNWNESAKKIDACVRGYYSNPCAWTTNAGENLKIIEGHPLSEDEEKEIIAENPNAWTAPEGTVISFVKTKGIIVRCKEGFYAITRLQKNGKSEMDYKAFMNGARNFLGSLLE